MKKHLITLPALVITFALLLHINLSAQVYQDKIFKPSIRSVEINKPGEVLSPPVIDFNVGGVGEILKLTFDDIEAGYQSWQYTFIHCNADWTPTDLWQNEYLNGFTDDYIRDYENSFNTLQPYTHYSVVFPNNNISFRIPGNYILKVYPEGDPDHPIFTRKIYVVDKRVTVKGTVKLAMSIDQRYTHQDVNFSIFNPTYNIDEPYTQLKVVIIQNFRWDNAIMNVKPLMLRAGEIDYQYTDGTTTFEGTNEFRYVDIKSLRASTERIRSIEIRGDRYIVDLLPDLSRAFKPYITLEDINGRFLTRTDYRDDVANEGEYAWVNFFVPYEVPFPSGTLFVVGQFNDWRTDKDITPDMGRMKYNFARQGYEARVLLKQGYYDYMYAFADDKKGGVDLSQIEGNHSETSNQYTILVYNREQGYRYDRLIAVEFLER